VPGQSLLKNVDNLLISQGQAGLTDVQLTVLENTLAGKSYPQMASQSTYTIEYLREVGSKLWQTLSQVFGESISKKNIQTVLRRYQESLQLGDLERQYFWGETIDVSLFYGRQQELQTLQQWVMTDHCRVIEILAIGGMGKTALAVKLAQQVQEQFDFVVWRSLRNAPPLSDFLTETIAILSRQQEIEPGMSIDTQISRLLHYLQQQRCLLILDNVESILLSGSPRNYVAGYEGYGDLLCQVGENNHQSCLLLTSREQVAEVASFAGENLPVRVLALEGLDVNDSLAILDDKGLSLTIEQGQELVDIYSGNPLALKIISTSILELFDGEVNEFLSQKTLVFNGIRVLLDRQFDRLSVVEQQIMYWLAINREWVSIKDLQADIIPVVSVAQLLESLEYLQGRSLIEKQAGRFTQQPVVMEYMTDKLLQTVRSEIGRQQPEAFLAYALMKAQSKDYLRDSQIRLIVQPLLAVLISDLGGQEIVVRVLQEIIVAIRLDSFAVASYGAGNCLNLLCQLQADLTGLDLGGLSILQADLRNVSLAQVNLQQANLVNSVFAESIGDIYIVAISPNNQFIATGGSDGKIGLWEVGSSQKLLNFKAHEGHILGLVFTNDSQYLISGSFDRYIKIWDVMSGACIRSWLSSDSVYRMAVSPDGQILASGSDCGTIFLWDIATGALLQKLLGHTAGAMDVAFQPDGNLLASSSYDTTIKLWDLTTGKCLKTLSGHSQIVFSINFNRLGTQLVSSSFDTDIMVWDVQTGQCLQTMQDHSRLTVEALFTPDDEKIVSCSQDMTIRIWAKTKLDNWQCYNVLQGHQNNLWSIVIDSRGKTVVSGDLSGVLKFWDIDSGQCFRTISSASRGFRTLSFHPQQNILASSDEDGQIRLWNLDTVQCVQTVKAHTMAVWKIPFTPSGEFLASCSMDGVVKLWEVGANAELHNNPRTIQKSTTFILTTAFQPQSELLAVGCVDNSVCFWNYRTNQLTKKFDQAILGDIQILDFAFNSTGKLLATAGHNTDIKIWDVETSKCNCLLTGHPTSHNWTVDFHPTDNLLASGGEDYLVMMWDVDSGELQHTCAGHTASVTAVTFNLTGTLLASASKDYTVRIWDTATGECLQILAGHTDLVNFVVFHPDPSQHLLASCGHDETIRLWDTDTWACRQVMRPQRIYENMNITGIQGLTTAQLATLQGLGAIVSAAT
jgi:WD40 repeat protein